MPKLYHCVKHVQGGKDSWEADALTQTIFLGWPSGYLDLVTNS